ncbi:nuclear transport factor 2 family protein [Kitasatospora sp. NPDC059646]|uniref:nuclear transport factor 2 family protein n=1 Tax=Kitasatospora sp. NPDC059646 TaxID=3346893 RepID=UPI0036847C99
MTISTAEFAALERQVRALTDRAEITGLVDGYLLSLDGGRFDGEWARRHFTADVRFTSPVGSHEGVDGLAEHEQATLDKFERTQHVGANLLIDLDGDRAAVRWNAVMTHVHPAATQRFRGEEPGGHFDVGGTFTGEAVRTPAGWRFRRLDVRAVWTTGRGPRTLTPEAAETLRALAGPA